MRIITLSGSNRLSGDFGERAAGDAFVARAEVFADVGGEVVDAAIEQRLGHVGRAAVVGGEQADFLGGADFFDHRVERVLREVGEVGFFPRLHHAGERELHARDVRHDDEAVLAELVAHVAGEAVEHRVAVDQQGDALVAGFFDRGDELVEVAADRVPLGLRLGHEGERAVGAEQDFGIGDGLAHGAR